MSEIRPRKGAGFALMTIGIAFLVLGTTGQKAFLAIGPAFIVIGIAILVKARRAS